MKLIYVSINKQWNSLPVCLFCAFLLENNQKTA